MCMFIISKMCQMEIIVFNKSFLELVRFEVHISHPPVILHLVVILIFCKCSHTYAEFTYQDYFEKLMIINLIINKPICSIILYQLYIINDTLWFFRTWNKTDIILLQYLTMSMFDRLLNMSLFVTSTGEQ